MLIVFIFGLFIGFAGLVKGADFFVEGSIGIAKYLNVPGLIIGLTIVAFGTSMPELAVSTVAAVRGSNEIALSNVLGSNIFNLMLILGISSLLNPIKVNAASAYDLLILIVVTMVVLAFFSISGRLNRIHGLMMVGLYFAYLMFAILRK